jgi:hypothetical protein
MTTDLAYSLHTIHHMVGDEIKVQAPGHVFPIDSSHVAELTKREAIREPTDDELALYNMANAMSAPVEAAPAPAPAPAPAFSGGKSSKSDSSDDDIG